MHIQANCTCIIPTQVSLLIFINALGFNNTFFFFPLAIAEILWAYVAWVFGQHPKTYFPMWPLGLEHILLKRKINSCLNRQHIFCDTKVYYWVDFLDLFSKVDFRKAWHCDSVIFLLPHQTCDQILLLLSIARFPCYFAPLFGETGLGIEVAVGNDKSLEAKIENMAKLLTQYCILRLADLSVISAKDNLTCKANTLTCCHHNCFTQF